MTTNNNQEGFGILELIAIGLFVTLIAFAGYRVINNKKSSTATNSNVGQTSYNKINSKADATTASKSLDQTPIDNQLDPDQLDSSIKSLL